MSSIPKSAFSLAANWVSIPGIKNTIQKQSPDTSLELPNKEGDGQSSLSNPNIPVNSIAFPTIKSLGSVFSHLKSIATKHWENRNVDLTKTKVKQVFLNILGIYSLISSYIYTGSILPTSFSALACSLPLTALSAALFMYSFSLKDYDDQSCLSEIKKNCRHLTLKEIAKIHSWNNIFQYQLVDQEKLSSGFLELIEDLSFKDALKMYKHVLQISLKNGMKAKKPSLEIPSPKIWREKFFQEIANQDIESILANYNQKELKLLEIISQEQAEILESAKEIILKKNSQKKANLEISEGILLEEIKTISEEIESIKNNLSQLELKKDLLWNCWNNTNYLEQQPLNEEIAFLREENKTLMEAQKRQLEAILDDLGDQLRKIQQDFISSINIFP